MYLNAPGAASSILQNFLAQFQPSQAPPLSPVYGDGFQPHDIQPGESLSNETNRLAGPFSPPTPTGGINLLPINLDGPGLPGVIVINGGFLGGGRGSPSPSQPSGGAPEPPTPTLLCVGVLASGSPLTGGAACGTGGAVSGILDFTEFTTGAPLVYSTNVRFDLSGSPPKLIHDLVDKLQLRLKRTTSGDRSDIILEVYGHVTPAQTISELAPC